jgi:hypothetical protein
MSLPVSSLISRRRRSAPCRSSVDVDMSIDLASFG